MSVIPFFFFFWPLWWKKIKQQNVLLFADICALIIFAVLLRMTTISPPMKSKCSTAFTSLAAQTQRGRRQPSPPSTAQTQLSERWPPLSPWSRPLALCSGPKCTWDNDAFQHNGHANAKTWTKRKAPLSSLPASLTPTPSRENTLHSNYAVVLATVLSPWQQGTIKNPHLAVSTTSAASGAAICLSVGSNWCTQLWSGAEQAASLLVCSVEELTTAAISITAEERRGPVNYNAALTWPRSRGCWRSGCTWLFWPAWGVSPAAGRSQRCRWVASSLQGDKPIELGQSIKQVSPTSHLKEQRENEEK